MSFRYFPQTSRGTSVERSRYHSRTSLAPLLELQGRTRRLAENSRTDAELVVTDACAAHDVDPLGCA